MFVSGLLAGHEPTPGPPEEGRFERLRCDGSPPERSAGSGRFTERRWITWVPQQMHYFRPAPPGLWTVCYHPNNWGAAQMRKFRDDVDHYHAHIASLEEVLDRNGTRESGWSAWLCTHPRLAEFLIRAELKLWAVTRRSEV